MKWKWTDECQKAFEQMKELIARETLLTYPVFNKPFEIHTDASQVQLGIAFLKKENLWPFTAES